jgi:hypothetical protein
VGFDSRKSGRMSGARVTASTHRHASSLGASAQVLMHGTKALRFRYEALVTDSQHLRDAAKVHYGSQGAAGAGLTGRPDSRRRRPEGVASIAQVAAIAPALAEIKASMPSQLDAIESAWFSSATGRGWG